MQFSQNGSKVGAKNPEYLCRLNLQKLAGGGGGHGRTQVEEKAAAPLTDRFFRKKVHFLKKIGMFRQKIGFCPLIFFHFALKISPGYALGGSQ